MTELLHIFLSDFFFLQLILFSNRGWKFLKDSHNFTLLLYTHSQYWELHWNSKLFADFDSLKARDSGKFKRSTKRRYPQLFETNYRNPSFYLLLLLLLLLCRFSHFQPCATPQTAAHQPPPSLGFSRQEHWSGLPLPSPMHESEKRKWSHLVVFYS